MLIPALIVVLTAIVVLPSVTTRSVENVSSWPMPLQESSCKRRDPVATALVLHLLIIHPVNGRFLRAYGIAAYGATTGRAKSSEALSPVPT